MTPNRVVALLTPLLAPVAGAVTKWLAENAPGVDLSRDDLTSVFIAGALFALAPALQWLHGWQKFEARNDAIQRDIELANVAAMSGAPAAAPSTAHDEQDDYDRFDDEYAPDDDYVDYVEDDDLFGDEFDDYDYDIEPFAQEEPAPAGG